MIAYLEKINGEWLDDFVYMSKEPLKALDFQIKEFDGDDIEIDQIWNSTTGEIYREYNDLPQNRLWTDGDELVVCSLLMWGDLAHGYR